MEVCQRVAIRATDVEEMRTDEFLGTVSLFSDFWVVAHVGRGTWC